jgi:two-component system phosphate regulon sensor histidine kinase PhoR
MISGIVILILDVTEKENAEKMRREFAANVSHELKTPLTSISGYAEIMRNGVVRAEDIVDFVERISEIG